MNDVHKTYANMCLVPAEAVVADISEPKSVVVPSEAPLSELGLRRQLLKDGGEEKVVPTPGRNDESEKLKKSEEEAAEGVLLALVNSRPGTKKSSWKQRHNMSWREKRMSKATTEYCLFENT